MRYIDLFCGIGGFRYGIEQVTDWECVYSNEWDKYANSVYRRHYAECDNRDIRTVRAEEIPDFDVLCAGFPCQSFSVAGRRRGFEDTRGTLFFEIARIVRDKKPSLLFLENVKGLLSHDGGNTFETILATLDELGYDAQWQVLNSKNHGVPQNRERAYIVGHLRGTPRPEVFPFIQTNSKDIIQLNKPKHSNDRIYSEKGISPTLNTMQGGRRQPKVMRQPLRFLQRNQKNIKGDYSFTIDASQTSGVNVDGLIRRLTPLECEKLQAFPDLWTQYGADGELISDTQRYKMCGNAVTTSVISAIVSKLSNYRTNESE